MNLKKVAIIGSAGIPAKYGGFETLAENITKYLGEEFLISVYCSCSFFVKNKINNHNNSRLIYIPIKANGIQSIIYDIISIIDAVFIKKNSIILVLGTSGSLVIPLIKIFSNVKVITNIDGLEHKRAKWNYFAKWILKWFEKFSVKFSDEIISDNIIIKEYVKKEYLKDSNFIAYGGDHAQIISMDKETKGTYNLPDKYAFSVCRIEPENHIELILKSFINFKEFPIVFIGNWNSSKYGKNLKIKYSKNDNIILIDAIYDNFILNQLRSNCYVYIHGHSAGGTNPSLVEAMCSCLPILAYNVSYNKETTFNKAIYFSSKEELENNLCNLEEKKIKILKSEMYNIGLNYYKWKLIAEEYSILLKR